MTKDDQLEAIQDGPEFYSQDGALLASFSHLVRNDNDLEGAKAARAEFRRRFPGVKLVSGLTGEPA